MEEIQYQDIGVPDTENKRIDSLEDAARYAYGLSETKKEIEKIKEIASKERQKWEEKIAEVNAWEEDVLKPLLSKIDFFNVLLSDFHRRQFNNAPNDKAKAKLKSIKLPYGVTLTSKENATQIEVVDDTSLLEYAKAHNLVDVPAPKPKWSEIKKQLKILEDGRIVDSAGEVINFVKAVPQERKFEVK